MAIRISLLVFATLVVSTTGCMRAVMQGIHEVRGAKAEFELITPLGEGELGRFESVRIAPLHTTLSAEMVPSGFHEKFNEAARDAEKRLIRDFPGGAPQLSVQTEVQYFKKKGLLSSALMVSRVRMTEGQTLVAEGVVLAVSQAYRAGGESALSGATLKAICGFLEGQKHPGQEPREDQHAE